MTTKKYNKENINIVWKPDLCMHSKVCWQKSTGLPEVFDPREKPWIKPENSDKESIIEQVKKCPSGALSIEYLESSNEQESKSLDLKFSENGPILIECDVNIEYKGELIKKNGVALCRCGQSGNKPFCDGTHRKVEFKD